VVKVRRDLLDPQVRKTLFGVGRLSHLDFDAEKNITVTVD
jgi:hypothetical protein